MKKILLHALLIFTVFSVVVHGKIKVIEDKEEQNYFYYMLNQEFALAFDNLAADSPTKEHLVKLITEIKDGNIRIVFIEDPDIRGSARTFDECECSDIYLSANYLETGLISTLAHEFEHIKHNMSLGGVFFAENHEIDDLTEIFGEYYYFNNKKMRKRKVFKKALYLGSAFLFYTEYKAFKKQVDAINEGVKDNIRPERNVAQIIDTINSDYFIEKNIKVNKSYSRKLVKLADKMSASEFLIHIKQSKSLFREFTLLQN